MKYLLAIVSIILLATVLSVIFIWPDKQPVDEDVFLTINGQKMPQALVDVYKGKGGSHHESQEDFLQSVITRQLLLQEAQRLGIDKEPEFRAALKTFFEHSLITTLMDRQEKAINVEISEDEIDKYLSSFGKIFTFTKYPVSDGRPNTIDTAKGLQASALFDDLAQPLKIALATLNPGETTVGFDTGNEKLAITLDSVSPGNTSVPARTIPREYARELLVEHKTEQKINDWIEELRQHASIKINKESK